MKRLCSILLAVLVMLTVSSSTVFAGSASTEFGNYTIIASCGDDYSSHSVMCYATMFASMAFSCKIKKSNVSIAVLIGILVLPLILRVIGIDWIDYVSLNRFYSGNLLFS